MKEKEYMISQRSYKYEKLLHHQFPISELELEINSADNLIKMAANKTLDNLDIEHELKLLGLDEGIIHRYFNNRLVIMLQGVSEGLKLGNSGYRMKFIGPSSVLIADNKICINMVGDTIYQAVYGALTVMELNTAEVQYVPCLPQAVREYCRGICIA